MAECQFGKMPGTMKEHNTLTQPNFQTFVGKLSDGIA